MPEITIKYPVRTRTALCSLWGYDGPQNNAAKDQFIHDYQADEWKRVTVHHEEVEAVNATSGTVREDAQVAGDAARAKAEKEIKVT